MTCFTMVPNLELCVTAISANRASIGDFVPSFEPCYRRANGFDDTRGIISKNAKGIFTDGMDRSALGVYGINTTS